MPALVLHGADDVLVLPAATEVMLGIPGVERRVLPGLRHEVLNEPGFEELLDEIVGWVRERLDAVA